MSQAEALLNNLASEETTVYTRNSETEGHIVIGNDRFITVPDSLKRIAVQYDHNIETVTFDCPRYWDNHDMSQMKVYINYILPNNKVGSYLAQNVTPLGNTMTFTWTISDNVTQVKGDISFLVCAKRTDDEGNETLHWNSELNSDCYISEGLAVNNSIVSKYPDIITQLLTRMDEVEAIATIEAMQSYTDEWLQANHARILAEIEAKGVEVLATIPDEFEYTHQMADYAARTRANAIVPTVEGETIVVEDSSGDYLRNLHIYGKTEQVKTTGTQLFNAYDKQNNSFGTSVIKNNGAEIAVSGAYYVSWPITLKAGVEYYINFSVSGDTEYRAVRFEYPDKSISNTITNPASFTPTQDTVSVYLYSGLGTEGTVTYNNFMINEGGAPANWEPYSGGVTSPSPEWPQELMSVENPVANVCGKNLLENKGNTKTENGITFHINDDKSITINGISTATPLIVINTSSPIYYQGLQLIASLGCDNEAVHMAVGYFEENGDYVDSLVIINGAEDTFVYPSNAAKMRIYIFVSSNVQFNDVTVYPMIRLAENTTSIYEPYTVSQSLMLNHTLRGIPVTSGGNYTDSNGQQWICDEVDFERGVYVQRTVLLELTGKETWSLNSQASTEGVNAYHIMTNDRLSHGHGYCTHFINGGSWANGLAYTNYAFWVANESVVAFKTNGVQPLDEFKTMIRDAYDIGNPVTLCCIRKTPIETPLTAEEIAAFKALRTNYPNTTILNDAGAHMSVKYNADTKLYVDNKISAAISAFLAEHQIG